MPPSLFSPYTLRAGTQILLTDLHYDRMVAFLFKVIISVNLLTMFTHKGSHHLFL